MVASDDGGVVKTGEAKPREDSGTVVGAMEASNRVVTEQAVAIGGVKAMPAVRALAKKLGVDLARVTPSGADGVVTMNDVKDAAKRVRGLAERGDPMCREIFRVQAHALGLFFDQMVNTFDPDALIVGGGAIEASPAFQAWFLSEIRAGMPVQREEQADIPLRIMPNGDTAGARGAAIEALRIATTH